MVISIDIFNISNSFLRKQTNNRDQGAMVRSPIAPRVATLKINVIQGKLI